MARSAKPKPCPDGMPRPWPGDRRDTAACSRMIWGQRAKANRREQPLAHDFQNRSPAAAIQHRMSERDGEHLVRPATHVIAVLAVDDVVEVAALVLTEAGVERCARYLRHLRQRWRRPRVLQLPNPLR